MARLFGTDGVRGLANGALLTPELALALAGAAARALQPRRVVIGRDTRPSGPLLVAAAAAGFAAAGCTVELLGVVPTPMVAHACATGYADLGLVVSASHNPMPDNGLKLFGPGGLKLPDAVEDAIAADLDRTGPRPTGAQVGTIALAPAEPLRRYVEHLLAGVPRSLDGLTVVVDCAQGAASTLGPQVYRQAGARVVALHAEGDGSQINAGCGATHPESLQQAVLRLGADLGLAHDGDADRCLAVDAAGQLVDGDQILAICALDLQERGELARDTLVATVMSNLGLHRAMAAAGIEVVSTAVGDRHVIAAMREGGYVLGGEQSGHIVLGTRSSTGDGLLTGLALMSRMAGTGRSLADLAEVVRPLPQVLVNVPATAERAGRPEVLAAVAAAQEQLGGDGRVLLRPSGTEPLVRIMVEAPTAEQAQAVADRLAAAVAG